MKCRITNSADTINMPEQWGNSILLMDCQSKLQLYSKVTFNNIEKKNSRY